MTAAVWNGTGAAAAVGWAAARGLPASAAFAYLLIVGIDVLALHVVHSTSISTGVDLAHGKPGSNPQQRQKNGRYGLQSLPVLGNSSATAHTERRHPPC